MKILLLLLLQIAPGNDVAELRNFLGKDFATAMSQLAPLNNVLLANVEKPSPQQAAQMRQRMANPSALAEKQTIVPLTGTNAGQGLVTFLFEDDFVTEQVLLVFCPRDERRVIAVEVLFDDRKALRDTPYLLQKMYKLPEPTKFEDYKPAMKYDLVGVTYDNQGRWTKNAGAPPVMVFDLGRDAEAIYQPIYGERLISGLLWIGDKNAMAACRPPAPEPAP
jgi:hypothetical protein